MASRSSQRKVLTLTPCRCCAQKGVFQRGKAWGLLRWKGVPEKVAKKIRSTSKNEWRRVIEPLHVVLARGQSAPAARSSKDARLPASSAGAAAG